MKHRVFAVSMALLLGAGLCVGAQPGGGAQSPAPAAPPGPGWDLLQRSCVNCHDVYMIIGTRRPAGDWPDIVNRMADRGAEVTPQELQVIEAYLVANFSLPSGEHPLGATGSR